MSTRSVLVALTAVLVAVTLASCSSTKHPAPQPSHASGIFGIVVMNNPTNMTSLPTSSPLPDGFGLDTDRPTNAPVTVLVKATTGTNAGKVVATVKPTAALFTVALPPGSYILSARDTDFQPTRVTVRAGQYTKTIFRLIAF